MHLPSGFTFEVRGVHARDDERKNKISEGEDRLGATCQGDQGRQLARLPCPQ
jgi:hypothetical protein